MAGNTIKFSVFANPLKDEEGRTTYQVRQDTHGVLNTRGLVAHMRRHHILPNLPLEAVLDVLKQEIVEHLFSNYRLHLDGLGTFYLNIGLKDVTDEEGNSHRRVVTDPNDITGNDLEVTGIGFTPDKEFQKMVTLAPAYFEHSDERGSVGHTALYTREEITESLLDFLSKNGYITRRTFQAFWHLTYYAARNWLRELTEGDNPPLVVIKAGGAYLYRRNPAYVSDTP